MNENKTNINWVITIYLTPSLNLYKQMKNEELDLACFYLKYQKKNKNYQK